MNSKQVGPRADACDQRPRCRDAEPDKSDKSYCLAHPLDLMLIWVEMISVVRLGASTIKDSNFIGHAYCVVRVNHKDMIHYDHPHFYLIFLLLLF